MKMIVGAMCALAVMTGEASAISRYTSTSLTCDQVQQRIGRDGAAIMRYQSARNPSLPRYGRYVANRSFCKDDEVLDSEYIRARDTESCPVNSCKPYDPDDDLFFFGR